MQKALSDLVKFGPFFSVRTHAAATARPGDWQSVRSLLDDPRALDERIATTRRGLAASAGVEPSVIEHRVAASLAHLAITARLLSPALAVAVESGRSLHLDPARTWWQPTPGGPLPISVPVESLGADELDAGELARSIGQIIDGPVTGLVSNTAARSVSARILWGNVASALAGAASMISRIRPDRQAATRELVSALLAHPRLAESFDGAPLAGFRRRSCCLIYRIAPDGPPALCGDCVRLTPIEPRP